MKNNRLFSVLSGHRQKESGRELGKDTDENERPKKRFKDLNADENKEYYLNKLTESRKSRSRQKIQADNVTDASRQWIQRRESCDSVERLRMSRVRRQGSSKRTFYRKKKSVQKNMPHTPRPYAKCVSSLIDGVSDSQKKEMLKKGVTPRSKGSTCKARVNTLLAKKLCDSSFVGKHLDLINSQFKMHGFRFYLFLYIIKWYVG